MVREKVVFGVFLILVFSSFTIAFDETLSLLNGSNNVSEKFNGGFLDDLSSDFSDNFSVNDSAFNDSVADNLSAQIFLDNDSCEFKSLRTCEVLENLGVVKGVGVPFVLPKNGVINMYFFDETIIGYVVIRGGLIFDVVCCVENSNQTHIARVSSLGVVEDINRADDFLKKANSMLSSGEIVLEANSFVDKSRLTITKAILSVVSWFS